MVEMRMLVEIRTLKASLMRSQMKLRNKILEARVEATFVTQLQITCWNCVSDLGPYARQNLREMS